MDRRECPARLIHEQKRQAVRSADGYQASLTAGEDRVGFREVSILCRGAFGNVNAIRMSLPHGFECQFAGAPCLPPCLPPRLHCAVRCIQGGEVAGFARRETVNEPRLGAPGFDLDESVGLAVSEER